MITLENFHLVLENLGFTNKQTNKQIYFKTINGYELQADFENRKLIYPEGVQYGRETTTNFSDKENFVVFECVHNLLEAGYTPQNITIEPNTPGGREYRSTYGDILVCTNDGKEYLLIECKTTDAQKSEFDAEWNKMLKDGGQLFNYYNSFRGCEWLCLYTSDLNDTGKIESTYHLISMRDNEGYLKQNKILGSFEQVKQEQGGKEDYFQVWKETYQYDFISHNLFESEAFKIGNRPYNINDLKAVDGNTIGKKYHQFATILRQHNVSARENAFDKLVNLFLCKVVDEKHNPNNLSVYWKGAASDDHYKLQDRLQRLYKQGMQDFLGEDVTYISEEQLDDAFILFKNQKDETKRTVLTYFKELKFYSNNPFAFLDVHNEKLFFQNAVILKEIVQMLQDIKLKNEDEQHQFLGDLFEGFLDQGVKQSEGQFFTPMPIVKFLISSLPLKDLLQAEKAPKVIDYACGAGHFLTEYASQIKPLLNEMGKDWNDYIPSIYGIEKEYRLSKVAKVSAFMYGQDEMNIIYADALAENKERANELKNGTFSLLVANPPYSVKGFLKTLTEQEKAQFQLSENVNDEESFRAIETFFIEKAAQLLATNGIAVIVLPASILSNGNIYIKCREILLANFEIVAIVELGSGTFGKTGTQTATLFLRRRSRELNLASHYGNRVAQWQAGNFGFDSLFEDSYLLKAYCEQNDLDFAQYTAFLNAVDEIPSEIAKNELFSSYIREFTDSKFSKDIAKRNKRDADKANKEKDEDKKTKLLATIKERNQHLKKAELDYIKAIEADKLKHFMLAYENGSSVLVVKMPSDSSKKKDNQLKKEFLGYYWSDSKGDEGIKYITGNQADSDNADKIDSDEDESDAIANAKGINQIQTPLFDPNNLFNESKINSLIRQHFSRQAVEIPENLADVVNKLNLIDMLDFSAVSFNKAIRTVETKKLDIISKYPLKTIAEITSAIETGKRPSGGVSLFSEGAYSLGGEHIGKDNGRLDLSTIKYVPQEFFKTAKKGIIKKLDILLCKDGALTGKVALVRDELDGIDAMINEHVFILRCDEIDTQKYLFNYLFSETGQMLLKSNITGAAQGGLNSTNLKNIKIPLPPKDVQKVIILECEKINQEFENSRMKIEEYRAKITDLFNKLDINQGGVNLFKIKELCLLNPSKSEIKTLENDLIVSFVEMASVSNNGFIETKIDKPLGELRKGSYTYFRENDVIIAKITPCMENGKCALATGLSNGIGMGSSEFHVFRADESKILPAFLFYSLNRAKIRLEAEKNMTGASGHRRVPLTFYEDLSLAVPDLETQRQIIAQIQVLETQITELEIQIKGVSEQKKAVLAAYL